MYLFKDTLKWKNNDEVKNSQKINKDKDKKFNLLTWTCRPLPQTFF